MDWKGSADHGRWKERCQEVISSQFLIVRETRRALRLDSPLRSSTGLGRVVGPGGWHQMTLGTENSSEKLAEYPRFATEEASCQGQNEFWDSQLA
jgi:hypothetical protein